VASYQAKLGNPAFSRVGVIHVTLGALRHSQQYLLVSGLPGQYPHPALRTVSAPVQQFDEDLSTLLENLTETLYATSGIGLCAPQVGVQKQVVVMDLSDDDTALEEYVNPEIVSRSGLAIATESCLSLPGISVMVIRSGVIVVKAVTGKEHPSNADWKICMQFACSMKSIT